MAVVAARTLALGPDLVAPEGLPSTLADGHMTPDPQASSDAPLWMTGHVQLRTKPDQAFGPSQLAQSLRAALKDKTTRTNEAGEILTETYDFVAQKMEELKKAGIAEAAGLTTVINPLVRNFCTSITSGSSGDSAPKNSKRS
ncbi:hypothetical protein DL771_006029 [Monosporascus sp. 5C6A]|nr:hypothetical protein DL771_006029 [Monosporascus sp. 5C6A]